MMTIDVDHRDAKAVFLSPLEGRARASLLSRLWRGIRAMIVPARKLRLTPASRRPSKVNGL